MFARRARDRAAALARSSPPARARGVADHRDRRRRHLGDLHRRPVGIRAEQRAVPGAAHQRASRTVGMVAVDGFAVFAKTVVLARDAARAAALVELPEARAPRRARVLRAHAVLGHRHDADDVGERPRHGLPLARDPVDRAVRARRVRPPAHRRRRRPGSSTSCSARSRRRCSSTASRSSTAGPARTNLTRHRGRSSRPRSCSTTACCCSGIAFLIVGLGFKVAAAPFHMWTPDVYQGAPTPVTAFMASATKAAAFAAILRVFVGAFSLYSVDWRPIVFALAVLSLLVGSIAAIVQTDVKRMLAYSSISHAGYILIGVQAASREGHERGAVLRAHVRGDDDRRVRGRGASSPARATTSTRSPTTAGSARRQPLLAGRVHVVPARAGRRAAHRRFRGEALGVQRGGRLSASTCSRWSACSRPSIAAFVYLRIVLAMYAPADDEAQPPDTARDPRRRRHAASRSRSPRPRCSSSASCPAACSTSPSTPPSCSPTDAPSGLSRHGRGASAGSLAVRARRRRLCGGGSGGGSRRGTAARSSASLASSYAASISSRAPEKSNRSRGSGGRGSSITSISGGTKPQLELEALAARVREARHHHVER